MLKVSLRGLSVVAAWLISGLAEAHSTELIDIESPVQDWYFELPLVPEGSYLEFCSYNFIRYDSNQLGAVCGPENQKVSLSLDKVKECMDNRYDLAWNRHEQLYCNQNSGSSGKMVGNNFPPAGPYQESCSGVLFSNETETLHATCMVDKANFKLSSISLDECLEQDVISNEAGDLKCVTSQRSQEKVIPFGSYLNDCSALTAEVKDHTLTAYCHEALNHSQSCTMDCYNKKSQKLRHDVLGLVSKDIVTCQAMEKNICFGTSGLFCSRELPDGSYLNLTPSDFVIPGSYLQYCNNVFYDAEHDVLNAVCSTDDSPLGILSGLSTKADNVFKLKKISCESDLWEKKETGCTEADESKFFTQHGQTASSLLNASQCVDKYGVSRVSVKNGVLQCTAPGSFDLVHSCGMAVPDSNSGYELLTDVAFHLSVLNTATNLLALGALVGYGVYCLCINKGAKRVKGYEQLK